MNSKQILVTVWYEFLKEYQYKFDKDIEMHINISDMRIKLKVLISYTVPAKEWEINIKKGGIEAALVTNVRH